MPQTMLISVVLPAPCRAQQRKDLAAADLEVDVLDAYAKPPLVALGEIGDGSHGCHRRDDSRGRRETAACLWRMPHPSLASPAAVIPAQGGIQSNASPTPMGPNRPAPRLLNPGAPGVCGCTDADLCRCDLNSRALMGSIVRLGAGRIR